MVVIIDLLRKLGLNKYESEAYITLIKIGSTSAFNLSKESRVPFGRIYDSLNTLIMKGLVEMTPSKPKKYQAIEPEIALNGLVDEQFNNLLKIRSEIDEAIKKINKQEKTEVVSITTGKQNFAKRVIEHFNYNKEYWATSDGLQLEEWYPSIKRQFSIKNKEAKNRFILINKSKTKPERIKKIKKAGVNIKDYPLENIRILVSDEELVTISIQEPKREWVNIHIKNKSLGKAMTKLLKTAWEK